MYTFTISLLALLVAPLTQAAAVASQDCAAGTKAISNNGLYSVNCQYFARNITSAITSSSQPNFNACLASCDSNPACHSMSFWQQTGSAGRCFQFADYDDTNQFFTSNPQITGAGAIAKCKTGRWSVAGKTFFETCTASPGSPDGYIRNVNTPTFVGCMTQCANTAGCTTVDYTHSAGSCALWKQSGITYDSGSTSDNSFAVLQ